MEAYWHDIVVDLIISICKLEMDLAVRGKLEIVSYHDSHFKFSAHSKVHFKFAN